MAAVPHHQRSAEISFLDLNTAGERFEGHHHRVSSDSSRDVGAAAFGRIFDAIPPRSDAFLHASDPDRHKPAEQGESSSDHGRPYDPPPMLNKLVEATGRAVLFHSFLVVSESEGSGDVPLSARTSPSAVR